MLSGGGVLPFYKDTETQKPVFLLGRERYVEGWRGSHRWSAFEGGVKLDEDDVNCAVREFEEESCGVLYQSSSDSSKLKRELREGDYSIRVSVVSNPYGNEHITFVKQMEESFFLGVRDRFRKRQEWYRSAILSSSRLKESSSFLPSSFPYLRENDVVDLHCRTSCVTAVDVDEEEEDGSDYITIVHCMDDGRRRRVKWKAGKEGERYCEWIRRRRDATNLLDQRESTLSNDVISVRNSNGQVICLDVNEDYCEKEQVELFTYDQLQKICTDPSSSIALRPYFMLVLERILPEFHLRQSPPSPPPPSPPSPPLHLQWQMTAEALPSPSTS